MLKKNKKIEISCGGDTLQTLIEILASYGVDSKVYTQVEFELDFSNCYYEGDRPSIMAVFRPKNK